MEIEILGERPAALRKNQAVQAIKAVDASSEFDMIRAVQSLETPCSPLLQALLDRPAHSSTLGAPSNPPPAILAVSERFKLNPEQNAVLSETSSWLSPPQAQVKP